MADAWKSFDDVKAAMDRGEVTSGDASGTRDHLKNNYLCRMFAAVVGIYGNSKQEAMYTTDAEGKTLSGENRYSIHFAPGHLPPVNAFWSLTMYELPSSLLSANALNRYLLNSPMRPKFKRDSDGGITPYIQNESPGEEMEANWLPAPKGPFFMAMRLHWPKAEALEGEWTAPPLKRTPSDQRGHARRAASGQSAGAHGAGVSTRNRSVTQPGTVPYPYSLVRECHRQESTHMIRVRELSDL